MATVNGLLKIIFAETNIEVVHVSIDEQTRMITLTPDPHLLMNKDPVETAHRLRGLHLYTAVSEDSGLDHRSEKKKTGLDYSKVDWG